jgi:hypothetical protein
MLMVNFMGTTNATSIPIIGVAKHFKSLMDEYIMDHKIGHTIGKNTKANRQASPKPITVPADKTKNAHNGVKDKKRIIAFPPTPVVFVMMVFMQ